jgi:hypothetical protein
MTLAHAAWVASELPTGEGLVPFAIIEVDGQRHLQHFEAESQEKAILAGKAATRDAMATSDAWAFVRDGLFNVDGRKIDALSVDFWAKGMAGPVTLIQQYKPPSGSTKFRLLGEPMLVIHGKAQTP